MLLYIDMSPKPAMRGLAVLVDSTRMAYRLAAEPLPVVWTRSR